MPLGVTLLDLRRELRAETGTSLNPAQGVAAQATLDIVLARQQRELWDAYNWQHLRSGPTCRSAKASRVYSYPKEMAFDQITRIYISTGVRRDATIPLRSPARSSWQPLAYGIKAHMMQLGPVEQGTPVRWRNVATVDTSGAVPITNPVGQFELLPTPPTRHRRHDAAVRRPGAALAVGAPTPTLASSIARRSCCSPPPSDRRRRRAKPRR